MIIFNRVRCFFIGHNWRIFGYAETAQGQYYTRTCCECWKTEEITKPIATSLSALVLKDETDG